MVAAKTADDLLAEVDELAAVPDAEGRIDAAGKLRLASAELSTTIAEMLVSARQERWVTQQTDVAITSGVSRYRVPGRALAAGVADVMIVGSNGEEWDPPAITASDRHLFAGVRQSEWQAPYGYTWEGDCIVLLPTPTTTQYALRVRYPRQPARLVRTSSCAVVTGFANANARITTAALPSGWSGTRTVDIVKATPHGDVLAMDVATTLSGSNIDRVGAWSVSGPDAIAVGDYVCTAGESCVLPIPESLFPVLVAAVVLEVVDVLGDADAYERALRRLQRRMPSAVNILEPRSRGETERLIRRNSPYRRGRRGGR